MTDPFDRPDVPFAPRGTYLERSGVTHSQLL